MRFGGASLVSAPGVQKKLMLASESCPPGQRMWCRDSPGQKLGESESILITLDYAEAAGSGDSSLTLLSWEEVSLVLPGATHRGRSLKTSREESRPEKWRKI